MDSRENRPPLSHQESDDDKPTTKKKKSTTQLGSFALSPRKKSEKAEPQEPAWSLLTLTKRRGGETIEKIPLAPPAVSEKAPAASTVVEPEAHHELPVEKLMPDEARLVARHIVSERQADDATAEVKMPDTEDAGEGFAATAAEAVESFRSKIIQKGHQLEEAFTETVQEIEAGMTPRLAVVTEPVVEAGSTPEHDEPLRETVIEETLASPFNESPPLRQQVEMAEISETVPSIVPPLPRTMSDKPRLRSAIAPAATELRPRGSGVYRLNTFARKDGQPSTEYVPLRDEFTLKNLPGGIVGYLIGRRRGRIKTEKKLAKARKKLEAQVEDLQESIITKENDIRKVVHTNMSKKEFYDASQQPDPENPRVLAMEANQLHGKKHPAERIGRVLINGRDEQLAGKNDTKTEKKSPKTKAAAEKPTIDKRVETLSRAELLQMSEKVNVDNTTLRQVYETHLVSEQGLRRLVSEYVRSGDVHEALREELVEHEIDFERDPLLRGQDHKRQQHGDTAESVTLSALLKKADILSQHEADDELAVLKARQDHHETQRERQQSHRRLLDVSMVAAITVLFILVVILLSRGR